MKTQTDIELKIMNRLYIPKSVEELINDVCFHTGVTKTELYSNSRKQEIVIARSTIAHFILRYHNPSPTRVGEILKRRHDNIIYYRDNYSDWLMNPKWNRIFNIINKNYE